ncbi:MFS transporter [Microbispora sp. CA-135349]|uniref:MFS transporter n=1 Tax=Microbispora sp. CA-135349 TaxID=3239953 RepID=UPI003D92785C
MRARLAALARSGPPRRARTLLAATLVLSVGKGTFLATVMVYLLQVAGLSPLAATTGLTMWGTASAAVAVPAGMLIDRGRGRELGAITAVCTAVLVPIAAQTRSPWILMIVLLAAGGFDSAGNVVRRAMLAGVGDDAVTTLAWGRTVSNVGFALGGLLSVWLLSDNSAAGYALAYLLIGGVYVLMAVCFATTPLGPRSRTRATARADEATADDARADAATAGAVRRRPRDLRTGAALAVATTILTVHATLLTTALPLWITRHTSVQVSVLGWLVMLNAVITIAGQIPVSRLAATTERALRCFRGSAVWTAACCVLLGLVSFAPPALQTVVLVAATIALTAGEMFEAAGEWGLSATLAGDGEHGFYQSACVLGEATQSAAGPLLVGGMVTAMPVLGWPALIGIIGVGRLIAGYISPSARIRDTRFAATPRAD